MSGRYENGFDYFQVSQTGAQICSILSEEGWYFPWGLTNPFGNAEDAVFCYSPGRYGYGKRIWLNALIESGRGNPGIFLALRYVSPTTEGWTSYGVRIETDNYHTPFLNVYDLTGNNPMVSITFEINGVVDVWQGGPYGTFLGSSDAGVWRYGVDFDVEVHWKISSSTGEVEVRIHTLGAGGSAAGSVPAVHLVNVNTQPTSATHFNGVGFGWIYRANVFATGQIDVKFDDMRFYDTAGAINNTWLGTMRVQTLLAGANGSVLDFTRSNTGLANYQNIGNLNIDDTLYLYDPNVGDYNLSTPQPLVNTPAVAWVGMLGFYRQDDATQHFVKNRISSSGVIADGASFATPQTYAGDHDVFELDPNTGVQFTGPGVNALQFGPLFYA